MKIFLSAVTSEFLACREAIASDLRAGGAEVMVQEDFRQEGVPLLSKLERAVAECDRFIVLVGNSRGESPAPAASPAGTSSRSYVEWELAFALGERLNGRRAEKKPVFVYMATSDYVADHRRTQLAAECAEQNAFKDKLRTGGLDRGHFGSLHELRAQVLRDGVLGVQRASLQNLPYPSLGSLFMGRDQDLDRLTAALRASSMSSDRVVGLSPMASVVLHGEGGVGKTRLAIEYAWRHADSYNVQVFVVADSPESLRRNLAGLVPRFGVPCSDSASEDEQAEAAIRWLERTSRALVVLDSVDAGDAAEAVDNLLPRLQRNHVLVTSRIKQWAAGLLTAEVLEIGQEAAASFLLERTAGSRRRAPNDAAEARLLAAELGGLALGLEQAGAFIAVRHCSLAEYHRRWREAEASVREWCDPRIMHYPRSLAATWEASTRALSPGAQMLLRVIAFLAPDPIPRFLFDRIKLRYSVVRAGPPAGRTAAGAAPLSAAWVSRLMALVVGSVARFFRRPSVAISVDFEAAIAELTAFSFARSTQPDGAFVVHRVIQDIVRFRMAESQRDGMRQFAFQWVASSDLGDPFDRGNWGKIGQLAQHLAFTAEARLAAGPSPESERALYFVGAYYFARGRYDMAGPLIRGVLNRAEATRGDANPDFVSKLNLLAACQLGADDYAGAEHLIRRALGIAAKNPLISEESRCSLEGRLSEVLIHQDRIVEAEEAARAALRRAEQSGTGASVDVAICLSRLSQVLSRRRGITSDEPEQLLRRAVSILERSPSSRALLGTVLGNLGVHLMHARRPLVEVEQNLRKSLEIRMAALGDEHPDVAMGLCNLGNLLVHSERADEGIGLIRKGAEIFERCLGPDYEARGSVLGWYSQYEKQKGNYVEAERLLHEALERDSVRFGEGHPLAARHVMALADLRSDRHRHTEAVKLAEGAIIACIQSAAMPAHMGGAVQEATFTFMKVLGAAGMSKKAAQNRLEQLVKGCGSVARRKYWPVDSFPFVEGVPRSPWRTEG